MGQHQHHLLISCQAHLTLALCCFPPQENGPVLEDTSHALKLSLYICSWSSVCTWTSRANGGHGHEGTQLLCRRARPRRQKTTAAVLGHTLGMSSCGNNLLQRLEGACVQTNTNKCQTPSRWPHTLHTAHSPGPVLRGALLPHPLAHFWRASVLSAGYKHHIFLSHLSV